MPQPKATDSLQIAVLRWFSDLEQRRAGYELRNALGWAHHTEVSKALDRVLQEELTRLAARGFLVRENIALPGRKLSFWLYRISERGADAIGAPAPPPLGPPLDPQIRRMIFSEPAWAALLYMRTAKTQASPARFATRELGWRTITEIRDAASSRRLEIDVWADDVYSLERLKLLDKRQEPGVARERPITFYRINDLGESVERIEWHHATGST